MLVAIEGVDCSGKTTTAEALAVELQTKYNLSVISLKFPMYNSPFGKVIKRYLDGHIDLAPPVINTIFDCDKLAFQDNLKQLVENNDCVILDRYYLSNAVYGAAREINPELKTKTFNDIIKLNEEIFKLIRPAVTFILDIDQESYRKIKSEKRQWDRLEDDLTLIYDVRNIFKIVSNNSSIINIPYLPVQERVNIMVSRLGIP